MPAIDNSLHMLNPYKFATYQFMRQYFSKSPAMYVNYYRDTTISGTKYRMFSYNDIMFRMILPFEAKFSTYDPGDFPSGLFPVDASSSLNKSAEWIHRNVPMNGCLPKDFRNVRNQSDPYFDKRISSGNRLETYMGESDPTITVPPTQNYAQTEQSHTSDDYFYPYHGSIFAAVIPVFTLNKVLKHREMREFAFNGEYHPTFPPNFFSTYTRTNYKQDAVTFEKYNNLQSTTLLASYNIDPGVYFESVNSLNNNTCNNVFMNTGVISQYNGTARSYYDDTLANVYDTWSLGTHTMNFASVGSETEATNHSALRLLGKLINNGTFGKNNMPNGINFMEIDMIHGLATHSHFYDRVL